MDATRSWASAWARALPLVLAALGLGGCMCSLPEPDLGLDEGCIIGVPCPDGTCVANWFGGGADACCGFGGECLPCEGAWGGGFECPDGTCAWSAEACCMHGGACDPGDTDGPDRASTAGESSSGSESTNEGGAGESTEATDDPSGDTSGESTDEDTTGDTDTGESTEGSGSTSDVEISSTTG